MNLGPVFSNFVNMDQESWIMDHGPCFGIKGHLRMATDVILRLSEPTIDFLSVFIGFRSQTCLYDFLQRE